MAVGYTTEFLDAANIAYDALPKKCKPGYYLLHGKGGKTFYKRRWRANQAQRLKAITKCWGEMDLNKLVRGLAFNHLEDFGYGQLGQAAQRARQQLGLQSPTGLQTGTWDTASSKQWTEVERRIQRAKDDARRQKEIEDKATRDAIKRAKAINRARLTNRKS
jgi:inhibitor of KinA sporulation pathway (predicted exonuclease)